MKGPAGLHEFETPHSKISSPTKVTATGRCGSQSETEGEGREACMAVPMAPMAFASPSSWHLSQKSLLVLHQPRLRPEVKWLKSRPGMSCAANDTQQGSGQRRQADRSCTNHTQRDTKPFPCVILAVSYGWQESCYCCRCVLLQCPATAGQVTKPITCWIG